MSTYFTTGAGRVMNKVWPKADWKSYAGFSLLFDNPGDSFASFGGWEKVCCRVWTDKELGLYRAVAQSVREMGSEENLMNEFMLFALPPESYHVTAWDGVNVENLDSIREEPGAAFRNMLEALSTGMPSVQANEFTDQYSSLLPAATFFSNAQRDWTIQFKLNRLMIRGDTVLIATLEPVDDKARNALLSIHKERQDLDGLYSERFEKIKNAFLVPHVAVGYFSNRDVATAVWRQNGVFWDSMFCRNCGDMPITFKTIGLYFFSDMLSYFRRALP